MYNKCPFFGNNSPPNLRLNCHCFLRIVFFSHKDIAEWMIFNQKSEIKVLLRAPNTVKRGFLEIKPACNREPSVVITCSVADPGCLSRIQDPGSEFFHPGSASASKNLSIFMITQKTDTKFSKQVPGCSSMDFFSSRIRIPEPGVKKHRIPDPDLQHRLLGFTAWL